MIKIGVYDRHPLLRTALAQLIDGADDEFVGVEVGDTEEALAQGTVKRDGINIMLICSHGSEEEPLEFLGQLSQRYDRVRSIMVMMDCGPQSITQAIRRGAKGIVSPQAGIDELKQAVLTVRNGFEFFSKSVTEMLVGKYVDGVVASETEPAPKAEPDIDTLSSRQIEILKMWGNNLSNKDIADKLYLSVRTVESHKNHIMQKLNLKTTVDIIRFGIRNNIIEL